MHQAAESMPPFPDEKEFLNRFANIRFGSTISIMTEAKSTRGGAGRGQGRKPLDETVTTVGVTIKMTTDQRQKLARLGGPKWVRARIDKAPEPKG